MRTSVISVMLIGNGHSCVICNSGIALLKHGVLWPQVMCIEGGTRMEKIDHSVRLPHSSTVI